MTFTTIKNVFREGDITVTWVGGRFHFMPFAPSGIFDVNHSKINACKMV